LRKELGIEVKRRSEVNHMHREGGTHQKKFGFGADLVHF
jgi:hypothetical protein